MSINSIICSFVILILLALMGCEKLPQVTQKIEDSMPLDQLLHSDTNKTLTVESTDIYPPKENPVIEQSLKSITPAPTQKNETDIKQVAKSVPLQPDFSPELLKIVHNWKRIPRSLLPFPSVIISSPTSLEVRSNGKVLASTPVQAGSEVTVIGLTDSTLTIAPPFLKILPKAFRPRMTGMIDIDKTDFKQCVAYKYEMTLLAKKRQIENKKSETTQFNEKKEEDLPKGKVVTNDPLAIPDPLDFDTGDSVFAKSAESKGLQLPVV